MQQDKIDTLIGEESDPKTRLTLLILSNLNKSIIANTELCQDMHAEIKVLKLEVDTHVAESAAARNQGMGAYKIVRVATPVLWVVLCGVVGLMYNLYETFQKDTITSISSLTAKVDNLESLQRNRLK